MLSIGIIENSGRGTSLQLPGVGGSYPMSDEATLAALTEQQKKEMFLKAREDLFPTPLPTPVVSKTASSDSEKKKQRERRSSQEEAPTSQKKMNRGGEHFAKPKDAIQSDRKDGSDASQSSDRTKSKDLSKKEGHAKNKSAPEKKRGNQDELTREKESQKAPQPQNQAKKRSESKDRSAPKEKNKSQNESLRSLEAATGGREGSQIHIVKSGYQREEGLMPPPLQAERGGPFKRYRYLTPAVRRAIDRAPVRRGRWKYIIVHNSGTRQGNARIFDIYHRRVRHMQNGLAYHFVIGNGHSSGNGQIEVGHRWIRQINGGHVASDYLNNIAIGICLVGDYNRDVPSPQQLASLEELISYLQRRVGRYKGRLAIVLGHREINPKPTDCPGRRFPLRWLHQKFPTR